jgi:molybdopterin molybdotransferase
MVEHTGPLGAGVVELRRAVAPHENVMLAGEDARQGDEALPAGRILRACDVGLLAALGVAEVAVGRRPRVGILSTGDELVPPAQTPRPGQIRDVNTEALCSLAAQAGAEPVRYGIVPDDPQRLTPTLARMLAECDAALLSGGSSLGVRDHTCAAILAQPGASILAHGVAISPGKPTILGRAGGKAVLGLPGQVASAQVVMAVLVLPFLRHLAGRGADLAAAEAGEAPYPPLTAELARNIAGRPGREDFVRVRLTPREGLPPLAHPVLGKSGLLKTLLAADGLVAVPASAEGLYAGALARVWLLEPGL